jgi:hypothetical protein
MVNPYRFYTYAYLREDRTPYYIGKGQRKRIYQSKGKPCPIPKDKNRIIFLKQNLTEDEAFKHEIYMIAVFGRKCDGGILLNKSIGGQGASGVMVSEETRKKLSKLRKGTSLSEETKRKISKSVAGKNHPLYGKSHSQESRRKQSEAKRGEKNHNYGKPKTEETKRKMSEAAKGRCGKNNPRYGKSHSKETKRKMSEAAKGKNIGKKWWNDGCGNTKFAVECPNPNWVLGRGKIKTEAL